MDYDVTAIPGHAGKPAVFFIHGLGMDKNIWVSPDDSRILGGQLPVGLVLAEEPRSRTAGKESGRLGMSEGLCLGDPPRKLITLFHHLQESGHTVVAWSQRRPAAEVKIAVSELRDIIAMHSRYCGPGIVLVGHSRGGLVAREYLKHGDRRVMALITLATPHEGSSMACWAKYLAPLAVVLNPILSNPEKGTLRFAVKRITDFLQSAAVREVLPGSHFFQALDDRRVDGVYYLSLGGNRPTLFSVYRRVIESVKRDGRERFVMKAEKVFSVPDVFERIIPAGIYPEEMKRDRGDGLVSVDSSRIPWADEHSVFDVNHAGILFDDRVNSKIADVLTKQEQ